MVETIIESALTVKPAKIHGLGDSEALINVYMANRPNFDFGVMEQEQSKEAR
jgi:hypothetical protein